MDLKSTIYSIARRMGVLHLTRILTSRGARVLCYHGVVDNDDDLADFQPKLFMRERTLERRLDYLQRSGLDVISLDDAFERIRARQDVRRAVILTFDDGWYGTFHLGLPRLADRGLPSTVYISSYYSVTGRPVYNVALQYLFWRFGERSIDLTGTDFEQSSHRPLRFAATERTAALAALLDLGSELTGDRRFALLCHLASTFGAEATKAVLSRRLTLATVNELSASRGPLVSLQLHTHRHDAPASVESEFVKEITDNRDALRVAGATNLRHFCYPSGLFAPWHGPWLRSIGVDSATTTVPGRWTARSDPYLIPRFVDSDAFDDSLFDAEMSGLQDVLRASRRSLRR